MTGKTPHENDSHQDGSHEDGSHEDGGFARDMARLRARRAALGVVGAGAVGAGLWLAFGGRPPGGAEPDLIATAADGTTCVKLPGETNGPYPADGTNSANGATSNVLTQIGVLRQDIRPSFAGLTPVAEGARLDLEIALVDAAGACAPLAGLACYIWQCDAAGAYSIYSLPEANYLRGLQVSDGSGLLRFTTLFPGTYEGRWPHIHFEVFASAEAAVSGKAALLTSQIALPGALAQGLYAADSRYAASVGPLSRVTFEGDDIFGDNTAAQRAAQMLAVTGDAGQGFAGRVTVGLGPRQAA